MPNNLYKDVLDRLPTAAIVVDENLNVRYCSRTFRNYFPAAKEKGSFRDIISCGERGAKCGEGVRCAYCALRGLFLDALASDGFAFRNIILRSGEDGNVTLRMKVQPMEKYLLGVADNAYETEIAREMYSAQTIQQRLLPPSKPSGGLPYSFMYVPCREIGGDLPDVYELGGETMGLIADVSGKGVAAGILSTFVKAGWDRSEPSPAKALTGLNLKFQELNLDERAYVTAAAIRVDREEKQVHFSMAGHNAPILLKSRQGISEIVMNAPPISSWIPKHTYEDGVIDYRSGDVLVMLTDGVTESRNRRGQEFTIERVEEILQQSENAERFIERLKSALTAFCGGTFSDDITAIAFDL